LLLLQLYQQFTISAPVSSALIWINAGKGDITPFDDRAAYRTQRCIITSLTTLVCFTARRSIARDFGTKQASARSLGERTITAERSPVRIGIAPT
jgi:hypothetical protein